MLAFFIATEREKMGKEIIERMKEIRKELDNEPRVVEVTKLGENGEPLKIYVWPITTKEYQKILAASDRIEGAVMTIIIRAKNEEKKPLFTQAERSEIIRFFGPKVIIKLARDINKDLDTLDDETGIDIMGN